ncbi:TPA: ATP phosphoribosyltransferase regulatory subunit, partial [Campylobacter upsaliensis]|nr:ATP phosphoribosyltransferase regulatory subunit [Campylobacter upsaliensis]
MINALKGMKDVEGKQAFFYSKIIKICEEVAQNYGFSFINTPHLELSKLFKRSVGESSDIVGKEMYEFIDKGGNEVCLRPEGTAGVVRSYIEHKMDKSGSVKRWFYHGSMFRYERPQKGRLREFHQFGVESFGTKSVYEDASLILMLVEIFTRLDIKFKLIINS